MLGYDFFSLPFSFLLRFFLLLRPARFLFFLSFSPFCFFSLYFLFPERGGTTNFLSFGFFFFSLQFFFFFPVFFLTLLGLCLFRNADWNWKNCFSFSFNYFLSGTFSVSNNSTEEKSSHKNRKK